MKAIKPVNAQFFVAIVKAATCFGCNYWKDKKENYVPVALHIILKI